MNRDWEQRLVNVRFAPQKRTFVSALSMSALCQKQTCGTCIGCNLGALNPQQSTGSKKRPLQENQRDAEIDH
jgi:hypothetical protein